MTTTLPWRDREQVEGVLLEGGARRQHGGGIALKGRSLGAFDRNLPITIPTP